MHISCLVFAGPHRSIASLCGTAGARMSSRFFCPRSAEPGNYGVGFPNFLGKVEVLL